MTVQEGQKVIEELKAQGNTEEEIAGTFYLLFRDGKVDLEGLEGLVNLLGYHLTDEFKAMDPEQQKNEGYRLLDEEEGENSEDDYEEDVEDEEEDDDTYSEEGEDEDTYSEEDEEEEAMNLFERKDGSANSPKEESEEDDEEEEKKAMKLFGK